MRANGGLAVFLAVVLPSCGAIRKTVQDSSSQTIPIRRATPTMREMVLLVDSPKQLEFDSEDREFGIGLESQAAWRSVLQRALQQAGFRTSVNRLEAYDVALEASVQVVSDHRLTSSLGGTLDPSNCSKQAYDGRCLDPAIVYRAQFGQPRTTSGLRKDDSGGWTATTSRKEAETRFWTLYESCSSHDGSASYWLGSMPSEGLRFEQAAAAIVNDLVTCDAFEAFASELKKNETAPRIAEVEVASRVQPVAEPAAVEPRQAPAVARPQTSRSAQFVQAAPQLSSYAVVIGIEHYRDVASAVGANADAERVSDVLRTTLGLPADHIRVALDERATRADIDALLTWLVSSTPAGGRAYFYFSGHGAPDTTPGRLAPMLMPYDANQKALTVTALNLKKILESLEQSKARESIVMLDTCFSGAGGRSILPYGERPLLALRPVAATSRMAVMSSSGADEISGAANGVNQGLFTKHLTDALGRGSADLNGDGVITLQELIGYVGPRVSRDASLANRQQTPVVTVGAGLTASEIAIGWGFPTD